MSEVTPLTQQPRRRIVRFSLRGLLLMLVAVAAALGWAQHLIQQARRERSAVAALEDMGFRVYSCGDDFSRPTTVAPEWLTQLFGEETVRNTTVVICHNAKDPDAGLAYLQGMTHLRQLDFELLGVTDAALANLRGLDNLSRLNLQGTKITDAGLAHLAGLSRLESLDLSINRISDAGLAHLEQLSLLKDLMLDTTLVSDAGLLYLRKLSRLELLSVEETLVTEAGKQRLQEALPNCRIYR